MLYAAEVTTQDELIQINKLNQQNLKTSLSNREQEKQGFVTWLYPVSLLQQMHAIAASINDDAVVGYALITPVEAGSFHPDLKGMVDNLEPLNYKRQATLLLFILYYGPGLY